MCFHLKQKKRRAELEERFEAECIDEDAYITADHLNGFDHPRTSIITAQRPSEIQAFHWGLIPSWADDISFRKNTLNAKIESIAEKPSFKDCLSQRCIILVDGFYEWQWLDPKGKSKQKYLISRPNDEAFALAGLWNKWTDKQSGESISTYTILTTEANELMSIIHNSKKRMPMALSREEEKNWLQNGQLKWQRDIELKAQAQIDRNQPIQTSLF